MSAKILSVDDDTILLQSIARLLREQGYRVDTAVGGKLGIEKLEQNTYDILLVDLSMPDINGFDVMKYALQKGSVRSTIVLTGENTITTAVQAMRAGAVDFITKPYDEKYLLQSVKQALQSLVPYDQRDDEIKKWRKQYAPDIIGDDRALLDVLRIIKRVSSTDCDVLITGASGTGKELLARAIHASSSRSNKPFVALNCAAIPKDLVESEIFGHVKGAFTGAGEAREGKFQVANEGTLFLDEIAEMDLSLQGKFLRVIQEREFTPVGDSRSLKVDVRIISATNQDLQRRSKEGLFREDLFYRLNVIPIQLPYLSERLLDIPLLVHHFVRRACVRHERDMMGIEIQAINVLQQYPWPGNVRELQNLIERVVVLKNTPGDISLQDLPEFLSHKNSSGATHAMRLPEGGVDLDDALAKLEVSLTMDALRRSHGNKAKAAELLGLKRTTLVERLKKLNLTDVAVE